MYRFVESFVDLEHLPVTFKVPTVPRRQTLKGGVLILAVEEHRRDVMNRLRQYGYTGEDPIWIEPAPVQDDATTIRALEEFIEKHSIVLVLIDTLASFFAMQDETDNAELTRRLKPILGICRRREAVIAILHHERKSGGEGGRAIRGGGAIFALVDQAFQLEKGDTPTQRRLRIDGRYKGDVPSELTLDYVNDHYVCLGTPEDRDHAVRMAKAYELLPAEGSGLTIREAGTAAGLSYAVAGGCSKTSTPTIGRSATAPTSAEARTGIGARSRPRPRARRSSRMVSWRRRRDSKGRENGKEHRHRSPLRATKGHRRSLTRIPFILVRLGRPRSAQLSLRTAFWAVRRCRLGNCPSGPHERTPIGRRKRRKR